MWNETKEKDEETLFDCCRLLLVSAVALNFMHDDSELDLATTTAMDCDGVDGETADRRPRRLLRR